MASSKPKLALLVFAAGVLLAAAIYFDVKELLLASLSWVARLGPWGAVAFIGLYILATVLFVPGLILTLGAGFLFGVLRGSIYVSIASTLGASAAFLIGRHLARQWVSSKIKGNEKFTAIDQAVAKEGWKIVGLLRLSPVFPFNLLNYSLGLTKVSLRDFFIASWIGMMPGTVMYVYLGSLAGDLASLGTESRSHTPAEWTLLVIGLLATLAVTVFVTRIARRSLQERVS